MGRLAKLRLRLPHGQAGISLVEVLVAAAIMAAIGVVFMAAMTTGFRSAGIQDEQLTAESLARSQLEIIKSAPYAVSYTVNVTMPFQYLITIESPYVLWNSNNDTWVVSGNNTHLQKITVKVSREGGKPVLAVEALKKE